MNKLALIDDLRQVFLKHNVSHLTALEEGAAFYMQGNTMKISGRFDIVEKEKLKVVEGGRIND